MDVATLGVEMNGLKILVVDDNSLITESMRFIFAAPRYQLTAVQSGQQALARLTAPKSESYDVMIIDQKMPYLTGVELVLPLTSVAVIGNELLPEVTGAVTLKWLLPSVARLLPAIATVPDSLKVPSKVIFPPPERLVNWFKLL